MTVHDLELFERWLPVVGYEGLYEVSDWGRIRSVARQKYSSGRNQWFGKILNPHMVKGGYRVQKLTKDGKSKNYLVHRLVAEAFIGSIPPGNEVHHIDSNPENNTLPNLEFVTPKRNMRHAVARTGKANWRGIGEKHPMSKLSRVDVIEIRRLYLEGMTQAALGKQFGVSESAIQRITKRKNWKHL
jgi:hypothetical protein